MSSLLLRDNKQMENFSIKCEAWQLQYKLAEVEGMFLQKKLDKAIESLGERNKALNKIEEIGNFLGEFCDKVKNYKPKNIGATDWETKITEHERNMRKEAFEIQMQKDYQELEDYNNNLKN